MNLTNCFVVFGAKLSPEVHLINETRRRWLDDGLRIASKSRDQERARREVYEQVFATGAEYALPAWSVECMTQIAEHYTGPHEVRLRGICAAIALGKPYGPNPEADGKGLDGGEKVPRDPVKPRPGSPVQRRRRVAPRTGSPVAGASLGK